MPYLPHFRIWLALAALAGLCALLPSRAAADSITITFDNATLTGTPGQTLTFTGIIANPAANVFAASLSGDSLTLNSPDLTADDTDFQNYLFASPSIAPGTDSGDINLFTVTISPTASAPEVISGNIFEVDGTAAAGFSETAQFAVDVTGPVATVPEPPALALMAWGLLLLLGLSARRKSTFRPQP